MEHDKNNRAVCLNQSHPTDFSTRPDHACTVSEGVFVGSGHVNRNSAQTCLPTHKWAAARGAGMQGRAGGRMWHGHGETLGRQVGCSCRRAAQCGRHRRGQRGTTAMHVQMYILVVWT